MSKQISKKRTGSILLRCSQWKICSQKKKRKVAFKTLREAYWLGQTRSLFQTNKSNWIKVFLSPSFSLKNCYSAWHKRGTGTVCASVWLHMFVVIHISHWSREEVLFCQFPLFFVVLVIGHVILHNFIVGVKEHVAGCTWNCILQVIH